MATLKEKFEAATEKVVRIKSELIAAEQERDLVYKQICNGKGKKQQGPPSPQMSLADTNGSELGTSATGRITAVLKSDTSKTFSYEDFYSQIPDVPKPTIRALLFKLGKEKVAEKAGRGQWKARI